SRPTARLQAEWKPSHPPRACSRIRSRQPSPAAPLRPKEDRRRRAAPIRRIAEPRRVASIEPVCVAEKLRQPRRA
uniref:Uncharacterized protein n=1 Tax=Cucumis melo TaxID=3656 RepID=A0A9I9E3J8_CUCME